jgi:pyruvate kinase
VIALPSSFDAEFAGDPTKLAGVVHARRSMTGYPAVIAREVGIPMVSGVDLQTNIDDGTVVTLDGDRGVVYRGEVTGR